MASRSPHTSDRNLNAAGGQMVRSTESLQPDFDLPVAFLDQLADLDRADDRRKSTPSANGSGES